jgi:hypothetical protein
MVALVEDLEKRDAFNNFISCRKKFEDILISHKSVSNQIATKFGSGARGYEWLLKVYQTILSGISTGKADRDVIADVHNFPQLAFLQVDEQDKAPVQRTDFSTETKSELFLKRALENATTCGICGGFIHRNSLSIDHIQRRAEGGKATLENGQLTDPYCNTGFKESKIHRATKTPQ